MALWVTSAKTFRGRAVFRFRINIFSKGGGSPRVRFWGQLGAGNGTGAGPFVETFRPAVKAGGVDGTVAGPMLRKKNRPRRCTPIWPPFREKVLKKIKKTVFFYKKN